MTQTAAAANLSFWFQSLSSRRYLYPAFIAGLIVPLGFSPFNLPGMTLLGIAVLFGLLRSAISIKHALAVGFTFGLGFFGLGVSWVFVSIHEYGHLNLIFSGLITVLFIVYLAFYTALVALLQVKLSHGRSVLFSCFLFSAVWCVGEYFRANFFSGFPWLLLGFGQTNTQLKFLLPLIGIYGTGFLTCLAATLLCVSLQPVCKTRYLWIISFVLLMLSPALLRNVEWSNIGKAPVPVGVIQANLSMRDKWDEALFFQLLQRYKENFELLIDKNKLIVMPESAIPLPRGYLSEYLDMLHNQAEKIGSSVLLGIPQTTGARDDQYYNSMITLGNAEGSYLKQHLVPFGEFIPGPFQKIFEWLALPLANMKPGKKNQELIRVLDHPIATIICYELAYPQLLRKQLPLAEWIVSISDDGWFGHSFALYQHLQMAQALSLQMARYQVVANNDGLSSIINIHGDLVGSLPAFSEGRLEGVIFPAVGSSPWVRWGDTPILLLIFGIVLIALIHLLLQSTRGAILTNL